MDISNLDTIFRQKQWNVSRIEEFILELGDLQKKLDNFCQNYRLKPIELSGLFEFREAKA